MQHQKTRSAAFAKISLFALFVAGSAPAGGQERDGVQAQVQIEQVEAIARHVARAVLTTGDSLTAEQEALVKRLTLQLAADVAFLEDQKQRAEKVREERNEAIRNTASYIAKGIAILIALLVLWSILRAIGKGVRAESGDAPLGVLIATRTEAQARKFGTTLVEENLATGGTVAPSIRSIYRREDGIREASEAMVFLKTTHAQLRDLIGRADELGGGKTLELVAISRVSGRKK